MFRQKKYICGNFLDVEIYMVSRLKKIIKREKKVKESKPSQKNLNDKNSQKYFTRLVHKNFTDEDLFIDLTYDKQNLPSSKEVAYRDMKNYILRLKRWRKKNGLPPLKYVYVAGYKEQTEFQKGQRMHHHMIINNMDRDVAEKLWGKGRANTDRMQFDEYGVTGKSIYMANHKIGERRWGASKGLLKPEPIVSDKKITIRIAHKMEKNREDRQFFEKLYPTWTFTDCQCEYNDISGIRFQIRMRRYGDEYLHKMERGRTIDKGKVGKFQSLNL